MQLREVGKVKSTQRTIGRVVTVSVSDRKGVKKTNIKSAVNHKPRRHHLNENRHGNAGRGMYAIGG
jgi:hypothetical protein